MAVLLFLLSAQSCFRPQFSIPLTALCHALSDEYLDQDWIRWRAGDGGPARRLVVFIICLVIFLFCINICNRFYLVKCASLDGKYIQLHMRN